VQHVRGDITGIWTNFTGILNVVTNSINTNNPAYEFRWANNLGLPNARMNLTGPITMYSRATANQFIPIGELTGEETTSLRSTSGRSRATASRFPGSVPSATTISPSWA